jgi:dipicolinate synthase subunit A
MREIPEFECGPPGSPRNRTNVHVLGGDERERQLIVRLLEAGCAVSCMGRQLSPREAGLGAVALTSPGTLDSEVVVAPMAGVTADGVVFSRSPHPGLTITAEMARLMPRHGLWLGGQLPTALRDVLEERDVEIVNLADHDVLAVLNSIPSAEGAIMIAMQQSPFCLHGAACLVLGYGRTAQTLAAMLAGLSSRVTVVARSAAARARAQAAGHATAGFEELGGLIRPAHFCFNTVPAVVLPRDVLALAGPDLLVVDLASKPGGTDFRAAEELGLRAILAPGLPGVVAPRTAGEYLAQVILALLKERGL